ncbi:hypothetical protein QTI66_34825 [Variovorax sp. J22R133]|uniref:hypothetical protein n=1 Tax=Variovorax brevis TaxID=3053503 RepID=UPI0025768291|nr:hypothetical protein [Variovorax sp. J22R133]MDM0117294.1 hypothetical protein [Variovorax sp. J22R133]
MGILSEPLCAALTAINASHGRCDMQSGLDPRPRANEFFNTIGHEQSATSDSYPVGAASVSMRLCSNVRPHRMTTARVTDWWNTFAASVGGVKDKRFYEAFFFGESKELADSLAELVFAGHQASNGRPTRSRRSLP